VLVDGIDAKEGLLQQAKYVKRIVRPQCWYNGSQGFSVFSVSLGAFLWTAKTNADLHDRRTKYEVTQSAIRILVPCGTLGTTSCEVLAVGPLGCNAL
jgi:hypothetical protein